MSAALRPRVSASTAVVRSALSCCSQASATVHTCGPTTSAAERARKRESLLAATEADLGKIAAACARARRPLRGTDKIAVRADRVLRRRKVAGHFTADIGEDHVRYARNQDSIAAEAKLDGIY